jgi:hypothetical protein
MSQVLCTFGRANRLKGFKKIFWDPWLSGLDKFTLIDSETCPTHRPALPTLWGAKYNEFSLLEETVVLHIPSTWIATWLQWDFYGLDTIFQMRQKKNFLNQLLLNLYPGKCALVIREAVLKATNKYVCFTNDGIEFQGIKRKKLFFF